MTTQRQPRIRSVPAVTKTVAILRLLSRATAPLNLSQISKALGIVPSSCLHILRILVSEELVSFDADTKRYSLDAGILTIARSLLRPSSFTRKLQDELDKLAAKFPVTAVAVRMIGLQHSTVVAMSTLSLRTLNVEVGTRIPALMSASGRCLAAFGRFAQEDVEQRFDSLRWDTAPTLSEWRKQIALTKVRGYAIDHGHYINGVTVIAAPVIQGMEMTHAISLVGVSEQVDHFGEETVGAAALDSALRASRLDDGMNLEQILNGLLARPGHAGQ